jgi:3-hydroxyacyl-[acyl-carrier-protein] dehydratase
VDLNIDLKALEITDYLPHRKPFLFVDKVLDVTETSITTFKKFEKSHDFYQGHFPDFPLTPGVILLEALMQSACIHMNILESNKSSLEQKNKIAVASRINDVKFKEMVYPDEEVQMKVQIQEVLGNAYYFKGTVIKNNKKVCTCSFTCTVVEK